MQTSLLDYALPESAIARHPPAERDGARLLVLESSGVSHRRVSEWPALVPEGALVVLNDTRVRRARIFGKRRGTGGKVEFLLLRRLPAAASDPREQWLALGRASKSLRPGSVVEAPPFTLEVLAENGDGELTVAVECPTDVESALDEHGHVPIPPYLARADELSDRERYQTVYARRVGSAAAPTAGLHLTLAAFDALAARGVKIGKLELEVGLGTFRPVTESDLDRHPMHSERFEVGRELCDAVAEARARGAPVIAVGTTVVRALESAADPERPGLVVPRSGETRLLIQPGYAFRVVDGLLTNFHAPRSTLLALVAAFAGLERVLFAYRTALDHGYRFLSYGDAMWIPGRLP